MVVDFVGALRDQLLDLGGANCEGTGEKEHLLLKRDRRHRLAC